MNLQHTLRQSGAMLAPDGIPLHFGDQHAEYRAALEGAVVLVRSHEGRLETSGRDRLDFMHRISTNDLTGLSTGAGRPTIFTNATARILDRATVYNRGETALVITEPGRGPALLGYLQRHIFFNDDARLTDLTPRTHQLDIHGPQADAVIEALVPGLSALAPFHGQDVAVTDANVFAARNKVITGTHWTLVILGENAPSVWAALLEVGEPLGLRPAGSLTYNALRIRAGRPAIGRELSQDYIPLEIGLWDEVSFKKGCYTGQEIIARMESRNRLARLMVSVKLESPVEAPADVFQDDRVVGRLTSSVTTPDGEHIGIAVVKAPIAVEAGPLQVGADRIPAIQTRLAGAPPPALAVEDAPSNVP